MRRIQQQLTECHQEQKAGITNRFSSNYVATLFPYFLQWRVYGSIYLYSTGSIQALFVTDPDMVKELANCKSLELGKPLYLQKELGALLGMGILTSNNGDLWAHQRKVIAPEFFMDKVKGMVNLMMEAANATLSSWENKVDSEGGSAEMVVDEFLRNFSADVISRASFGSSFSEGKEIFNKIRQLQMTMAKQKMLIGVPRSRYLPTMGNREIWRLGTSIGNLILETAKRHEHDSVTSVNKGHETTSTTAAWCLMLLASHPKWQSSARAELLDVCQGNTLDADMLRKKKMLTMVIQETLRLYPPSACHTGSSERHKAWQPQHPKRNKHQDLSITDTRYADTGTGTAIRRYGDFQKIRIRRYGKYIYF
ncbi:hypothetical protein PVAP13_9KG251600 [Panicum virgatum]|uniref:Cytochrome P450 n=1 Tax=Panicum virgatum TaxID=38727 RepID=A0A8T0NRT4_PANVG|nr:hypothetical protein PVAP13_9KG251600 [Panicum virgatum]